MILFKLVKPETFKHDNNVVSLFNVLKPDIFNDDINVVELYKVVEPETFNIFDNIESPLILNANVPDEVILFLNL